MRFIQLLLFFCFLTKIIYASSQDSARAELINLLKERKILSDEYYSSLNKKSGFFGNQTKNDIRTSQEKLVIIVKTDNKIMNVLNRTLDYRTFEKSTMTYDANSYEERIRNLSTLNDTLNKQIISAREDIKSFNKTIKRHDIYFTLLIILLALTLFIILRKLF